MEIVNPLEVADWDSQLGALGHQSSVIGHRKPTIFHSTAWARVLQETYGYHPCYLVQGKSVLPVMEVNSRITGKRGVSLPFTDQCEPLGFEPESFHHCLKALSEYGKSRSWKYWELRGGESFMKDIQPSVQFYTHTLDLSLNSQPLSEAKSRQVGTDLRPPTSDLCERFDSSVRRAIRKAEKSDVKVEVAQDEASMKAFYRLQCSTRQKHGLPPQPWLFFQNIQRHVISKGLGFLVMASRGQTSLAASLYLLWGKQAIYKFGASDERLQEFRASNLVMWRAIQHCIGLGLQSLYFGRTSLANDGLRRFKLGWGTREETKAYYKFDLRKHAYVADTDRASGWHNQVFRKMPQPLLRATGNLLYKHIA